MASFTAFWESHSKIKMMLEKHIECIHFPFKNYLQADSQLYDSSNTKAKKLKTVTINNNWIMQKEKKTGENLNIFLLSYHNISTYSNLKVINSFKVYIHIPPHNAAPSHWLCNNIKNLPFLNRIKKYEEEIHTASCNCSFWFCRFHHRDFYCLQESHNDYLMMMTMAMTMRTLTFWQRQWQWRSADHFEKKFVSLTSLTRKLQFLAI